jgi:hypothetical protein
VSDAGVVAAAKRASVEVAERGVTYVGRAPVETMFVGVVSSAVAAGAGASREEASTSSIVACLG